MFEWKPRDTGHGASGENLYLGRWRVASVGWDGVNKTEFKWIVYLYLPGLKTPSPQQYKLIEEAKTKAQNIVLWWIKEAKIGEHEK